MAVRSLNKRQSAFIREYLVDGNGRQAAIRAGYAESAAHVTASRMLTDESVLMALRAARNRVAMQERVTPQACIERLWELANDGSIGAGQVYAADLLCQHFGLLTNVEVAPDDPREPPAEWTEALAETEPCADAPRAVLDDAHIPDTERRLFRNDGHGLRDKPRTFPLPG